MLKILLLLAVTFSSIDSKAYSGGSGGSPSLSRIGFRFLGNLKLQHGTLGSNDGSVKKRKVNSIGAEAIGGINLGPLILGAGAEYSKLFQMTDPDDVSDTNLSGGITQFSGVAGFAFGKLCLLGKYYFKSSLSLDQKSPADEKVQYLSPDASYGISILYRPGGRSFWGIDYNNINFSKEDRAGTTNNFSADETMNLSTFGISYGFMF